MSLSCLYNYIGIQGCNSTAPNSGIYINSLAGVSLSSLEKLSKDESPTFLAIWNEIQNRAIRRMQMEVFGRFAKRFKIQNIRKSYDFGLDYDATAEKITSASTQYRGLVIDDEFFYPATQQQVKRSAFMCYYIQTLTFYSPIAQPATVIKVFDISLSSAIDTITFDASIGWNTIQVNKTYSAWSLFLGVDSTNINSVYKYVPSTTQKYPVNVRGGSMTIGANTSTISLNDNSFGLGGVFGVRCKFDPVVCSNLDVFATPFSYLCASELMQERLSSDRINKYTVDKKQAEELKAYYDAEFAKAIDIACDYIQLDIYDECLECNEQMTIRESNFFPTYRRYDYEDHQM